MPKLSIALLVCFAMSYCTKYCTRVQVLVVVIMRSGGVDTCTGLY